MAAIASGVLIVGLDGTITAVANPVLAADLGATLSGLQWITNIYLLAMAATLVLSGKLGDRLGRRRVFMTGVVGFGVASATIAMAPAVSVVIAGRLGQGLFGALIVTNAVALLRETFPPSQLPKALSVFSALIGASAATGPLIGGFLIEHTSWRWAFLINVPIAAVSIIASLRLLPKGKLSTGASFDVLGAVLLGAGLLGITYGLIDGAESGWGEVHVVALIVIGVVLAVAFVFAERRAKDPLTPLRLFADRNISLGLVLSAMSFFALVGAMFFILLFLQQVNGDSPMQAGLHFLPLSVANVVAAAVCGRILVRFGARPPLVAGMALTAIGFVLFTRLEPHQAYIELMVPFVLLGFGVGLVMTSSVQSVIGSAAVDDAGPAAGAQQTALQIGGILGTSGLGAVMAYVVGSRFGPAMVDEGVPDATVDALAGGAVRSVGQGVPPALGGVDERAVSAVERATEITFMDGLHMSMWVGAAVALTAAVLALFLKPGPVVDTGPSVH
ncbi:DHA2 family efflux MFS transporter permease subunit [Rhodococcus sp. 077-4]|uniref:DHA2 family efflux MFS transporter permease subunit n=1 Tax=Rhodococcus sp. 077-4 TaxID=2789271 RepID=UPI0039F5C897